MAERRLSLDEANRTLPLLRPIVQDARARYLELRRDLETLDSYRSLEEISSDASIPPNVRGALGEVEACLRELKSLSATLIDPEMGVVSIAGRLPDGRDVHLCWKLGEERIRFWYPLGGRYDERLPVPSAAAV